MTCTGSSTLAQPRPCGPTAMPAAISTTTAGRRRPTSPTASGATTAAPATTASGTREISMGTGPAPGSGVTALSSPVGERLPDQPGDVDDDGEAAAVGVRTDL